MSAPFPSCGTPRMLAVLALFSLCSGSLPLQAQAKPNRSSVLAGLSEAVEDLCDAASPAVVQIEARSRVLVDNQNSRGAGFFAKQWGTGSGVIVDASGYIITNAHVVAGSNDIDVSVADTSDPGQIDAHNHFAARVIGIDKEIDLAVLKVDADHLPSLSFRDSDKLKQGQIVFALGSPLGLRNTLTVGYISAISRQLNPEQPTYYIQTDAPINPGNSGGPLLDLDGKIAGINTMIFSQSGGSEGIGFAIPGNLVRRVYEQLRKDGRIHRGTIGVIAQDISPVMSQALGLNRHPGVILSDVLPMSSGQAAGLEPNDIVLSIEGRPVTEARQVQEQILQQTVGAQITLGLLRGKETLEKAVTILERPNPPVVLSDLIIGQANLMRELGVLALTLDEKVTPNIPETRRLYGVVVAAIAAEFAAVNPGLRGGDVIYAINGTTVHSLEELRAAMAKLKQGDPVALLTERDRTLGYVSFTLE